MGIKFIWFAWDKYVFESLRRTHWFKSENSEAWKHLNWAAERDILLNVSIRLCFNSLFSVETLRGRLALPVTPLQLESQLWPQRWRLRQREQRPRICSSPKSIFSPPWHKTSRATFSSFGQTVSTLLSLHLWSCSMPCRIARFPQTRPKTPRRSISHQKSTFRQRLGFELSHAFYSIVLGGFQLAVDRKHDRLLRLFAWLGEEILNEPNFTSSTVDKTVIKAF